jgi:hypothetical protein
MDNVFHLAGGRTLSDATISFEEITNENQSEESSGETEETEEVLS